MKTVNYISFLLQISIGLLMIKTGSFWIIITGSLVTLQGCIWFFNWRRYGR
jgi:hypothetical protein